MSEQGQGTSLDTGTGTGDDAFRASRFNSDFNMPLPPRPCSWNVILGTFPSSTSPFSPFCLEWVIMKDDSRNSGLLQARTKERDAVAPSR